MMIFVTGQSRKALTLKTMNMKTCFKKILKVSHLQHPQSNKHPRLKRLLALQLRPLAAQLLLNQQVTQSGQS